MSDDLDPSDLDARIRRDDPDRWLASRFAGDAQARSDLMVLYAFNDELARVAAAVSNPMLGEIRFAWWSEALDEIHEGRPVRRHPVAEALAETTCRRSLPRQPFDAMIAARHADLDAGPFPDAVSLYHYLDGASASLMRQAAAVLGAPLDTPCFAYAARAWGVAGLARAHWGGAPNRLPPGWTAADLAAAVDSLLSSARAELKALPVGAFPAVAYVALAGAYAHRRELGPLARQGRILWAVLRGQL